jgi:hypothetical protein
VPWQLIYGQYILATTVMTNVVSVFYGGVRCGTTIYLDGCVASLALHGV